MLSKFGIMEHTKTKWSWHPEDELDESSRKQQNETRKAADVSPNIQLNPYVQISSVEDEFSMDLDAAPSLYLGSIDSRLNEMAVIECEECAVIRSSILYSPESILFWEHVRRGPKREGCHEKYIEHFLASLREYSAEQFLEDPRTVALLKQLSNVDIKDNTAIIRYSVYARLVSFYGPVRRNNCIMVKQIHHIAEKSVIPVHKGGKPTVSWFAGDMGRETAESCLAQQGNGTYLIRMSQSSVGSFVISVMHEEIVQHIEIEGDAKKALQSEPYSANLQLHGFTYPTLVDAVQSLRSRQLVTEDGLEIMCNKCCPGLPINGIITAYKKSKKYF